MIEELVQNRVQIVVSRTFRGTRTEALAALQRLIVGTGRDLRGGSTATVALLLGQFMATASLAPTTLADWKCVIDNQLLPAVGDTPLWQLTARDCDELYTALREDGLGPSRVRCAHVVLHRAVAQAVRWGWLTHNPVSYATRPDVPRSTIRPPDASDVRALIAHAASRPSHGVLALRGDRHRRPSRRALRSASG